MNNELVKRINATNRVKERTHGSVLVNEQMKYDRLFHAIPVFNQYEPTFNENKFELLIAYNVPLAITRHCLKQLASKGNLNAIELLNGVNHTVSLEDLTQEVTMKFIEYSEYWEIDYVGKVNFSDDSIILDIFKSVSGYLRKFQTKHFKHLYIELDGNIVDANKVSALADYVSIDNLLEDITLQKFMEGLTLHDKTWLELRLEGLSNKKIAESMNVTYEKIRATEKRVRKYWNENK